MINFLYNIFFSRNDIDLSNMPDPIVDLIKEYMWGKPYISTDKYGIKTIEYRTMSADPYNNWITYQRQGVYKKYYECGKLHHIAFYHDHKNIGKCITYNKYGRIVYIINYDKNGLQHGETTSYFSSKEKTVWYYDHGTCRDYKRFSLCE